MSTAAQYFDQADEETYLLRIYVYHDWDVNGHDGNLLARINSIYFCYKLVDR